MTLIAHVVAPGAGSPIRAELQLAPSTNTGFRELCPVTFEIPPGGPFELRIDDERLPVIDGKWSWKPGFFAGEVTAELIDARGRAIAQFLLDVSPTPAKLGRTTFASMLSDLVTEDPALALGSEPSRLKLGAGPQSSMLSVLVAFARVRAHAPLFIRALRAAARHPRRVQRRARAFEPPHRVRRVDVASLLRLAAGGWGADEDDFFPLPATVVDVPVTEPSVDSAANRALVAQAHALLHRVQWLSNELPRLADGETSETRTPLEARTEIRLGFLNSLKAELRAVLRCEPWSLIRSPELTAAGLTAITSDPVYARAYQQGWKALRVTLSGDADERMWLSPSWEVFERWCFVRLAKVLRDQFPALTWTRHGTGDHDARAEACWRGVGDGGVITLLLQPEFQSFRSAPPRWGMQSISRQRYPDLMLAVERGDQRSFILLDAKYRVSRQGVLEAMESAHIYRDALRWHGQRAEYALLLLPAPTEADWLCDADFQRRERVGASPFVGALPEILSEALRRTAFAT